MLFSVCRLISIFVLFIFLSVDIVGLVVILVLMWFCLIVVMKFVLVLIGSIVYCVDGMLCCSVRYWVRKFVDELRFVMLSVLFFVLVIDLKVGVVLVEIILILFGIWLNMVIVFMFLFLFCRLMV